MKSKRWAAASAVAAVVIAGGVSAPAMAASHRSPAVPQAACGPDDYNYKDVADSYTFTKASGKNSVVSGDPGVTLTISRSTTFTVGGSISYTASISEKAIVVTVQEALGITITASYSGTSSSSGAWKVPDSYKKGGRLEIGGRVHSGAVQKYHAKPTDCSDGTFISAASYDAPEEGWYFKHVKI